MLGIDRRTGKTITGFEQFVSRMTQVLTTRIGSREKRRGFGAKLPSLLSKATTDQLLTLAQTYAIEACHNPAVADFAPSQVVASRTTDGIKLQFYGTWNGDSVSFGIYPERGTYVFT